MIHIKRLLLISIFIITASALQSKDGYSNFNKAEIVSVYDGDTFKITLPCRAKVFCRNINVRVKGIDCPEIRTSDYCEYRAALRAKNFTELFLSGGQLSLRRCKRDKYFRLLCEVYVKGESLSQELSKAGLAYVYDGGKRKKRNWCGTSGIF